MLLGQEAFTWSYRYIERYLTRYGGTAARILFFLSSDENDSIIDEMVTEFGHVLRENLRRSDIILHWQQSRYLVVMPHLNENDIPKVTERIMESWNKMGFSDRMTVDHTSSVLTKEKLGS